MATPGAGRTNERERALEELRAALADTNSEETRVKIRKLVQPPEEASPRHDIGHDKREVKP